ncbi:MAG: hypothetical protein ABIS51_21100 [Sphingomonas sp.]
MSILLLFLATVIAVELAWALRLVAVMRDLGHFGARASRVMRRRGASDASRERAAMILSARMFRASMRSLLLLVAVAAPIVIVIMIADAHGAHLGALFIHPEASLALPLLCLSYAVIRYQVRKRL